MKVIIIGGVAAGAGAAARLRRLNENAEIILLERGEYVSYANCGLPYHIGGVIADREELLVMPAATLRSWFNLDIRTKQCAVEIDRAEKKVKIHCSDDGCEYWEYYDYLVLATGSSPLPVTLPGGNDDRIHPLWTIPDMDKIIALIEQGAQKAIVVGGGFIGLEVAENLRKRNMEVAIIQHSGHVLPSLDCEMAQPLAEELLKNDIKLYLNSEVTAFEKTDKQLFAVLNNGEKLAADLVIMSVGVRPNSELAMACGLRLGTRGHIWVDEKMQTSDAYIYAAGDAVEIIDPVSHGKTAVPLAGPAGKQARIIAENISGCSVKYHGSYAPSVIKIGRLTAGSVGLTEQKLRNLGIEYKKIYTHPGSNASYYPGGSQMHMKLMFALDGKILGAQIVGVKGVDKRIDVIGTAMQCNKTAMELARLELAYAPPYNSAKDPVNFLGMIAGNILNGCSTPAYYQDLTPDKFVLDVREPAENAAGAIPGCVNIPLSKLRSSINQLPKEREIIVFCRVGLRGYIAERILKHYGFKVSNFSGGYLTWAYYNNEYPQNCSGCLGLKK